MRPPASRLRTPPGGRARTLRIARARRRPHSAGTAPRGSGWWAAPCRSLDPRRRDRPQDRRSCPAAAWRKGTPRRTACPALRARPVPAATHPNPCGASSARRRGRMGTPGGRPRAGTASRPSRPPFDVAKRRPSTRWGREATRSIGTPRRAATGRLCSLRNTSLSAWNRGRWRTRARTLRRGPRASTGRASGSFGSATRSSSWSKPASENTSGRRRARATSQVRGPRGLRTWNTCTTSLCATSRGRCATAAGRFATNVTLTSSMVTVPDDDPSVSARPRTSHPTRARARARTASGK